MLTPTFMPFYFFPIGTRTEMSKSKRVLPFYFWEEQKDLLKVGEPWEPILISQEPVSEVGVRVGKLLCLASKVGPATN